MNNLHQIQQQIAEYEIKYGRKKGSVHLLAASKGQSVEKILSVYESGQRLFGENYLQEALLKIASLPYDIEWHYIGPIQSNKTKKIAEHFAWVQSVADKKIAQRLNDQRPERLPPLNICIEVNADAEITKSGITPEQVEELATFCSKLSRLKLRGLMTIPAPKNNFDAQCEPFKKIFSLYQSLQAKGFALDTLSMGMSADFEAAIASGSTLVRIGTAIFGQRK